MFVCGLLLRLRLKAACRWCAARRKGRMVISSPRQDGQCHNKIILSRRSCLLKNAQTPCLDLLEIFFELDI